MMAKLYHTRTPSGRALLVAKAIQEASPSLGAKAVKLASELFSELHPKEKSMALEIEAPSRLKRLQEVCGECGIEVSI